MQVPTGDSHGITVLAVRPPAQRVEEVGDLGQKRWEVSENGGLQSSRFVYGPRFGVLDRSMIRLKELDSSKVADMGLCFRSKHSLRAWSKLV